MTTAMPAYPPSVLTPMDVRSQLEIYERQAGSLRDALVNVPVSVMNEFPIPGTWSLQQIVIHLVDSDLVMSDRMKRIIAEDNPSIIGFDEGEWVKNLRYEQADAELAGEFFSLNRRIMSPLLKSLPAEAFSRQGTHNQRGAVTLAQLVNFSVWHLDHHMAFFVKKREMLLGKSGA